MTAASLEDPDDLRALTEFIIMHARAPRARMPTRPAADVLYNTIV
jgi:hypothetical protein